MNFSKMIALVLIISCTNLFGMQALRHKQDLIAAQELPAYVKTVGGQIMLNRDKLFDDIMGISEKVFQNKASSNASAPRSRESFGNKNQVLQEQIKKYPRAASILKQDDWQVVTIEELDKNERVKELKAFAKYGGNGGRLIPLVHDDNNPKETDIRYLHTKYPNAFFLIASNFNALEGGMGDYNKDLGGMNWHPVQGEEAAMATMPATIWRRYFAPNDINFLSQLGDTLILGTNEYKSPIIQRWKEVLDVYTMKQNVRFKLQMGVHKNIVVSSGYNNDEAMVDRGDRILKPKYNARLPVEGSDAVFVSHLYAAAHNMSAYDRDKNKEEYFHHAHIASAVLHAVYELAILSAYVNDAKEVVLTMIGASAFQNDPQWIINALDSIKNLIARSGMTVYIVVRHRDKKIQDEFERKIKELAEEIKKY